MTDQGLAYSSFIAGELAREEARRADINTQARAVMTASGALFGLATAAVLFVRGSSYVPPGSWSWLFVLAMTLYLLSAATGIMASRSHKTAVPAPQTLSHMLRDHWTDDNVTALNFIAQIQVKAIEALREGNNCKTRWLKRSLWVQIAAVVVLTTAVVVVAFADSQPAPHRHRHTGLAETSHRAKLRIQDADIGRFGHWPGQARGTTRPLFELAG